MWNERIIRSPAKEQTSRKSGGSENVWMLFSSFLENVREIRSKCVVLIQGVNHPRRRKWGEEVGESQLESRWSVARHKLHSKLTSRNKAIFVMELKSVFFPVHLIIMLIWHGRKICLGYLIFDWRFAICFCIWNPVAESTRVKKISEFNIDEFWNKWS